MPDKKKCAAERKKALEELDSFLAEIDKTLEENTIHGTPPRRLRRVGRSGDGEPMGTTGSP